MMIPEREPFPDGAPRPRRSRWVRIALALVPAVAFLTVLAVAVSRSGPKAVSGDSAPGFELPLLDGSGMLTDEDLRGKPVVINFWASWCIPCREEAPLFERAWKTYQDQGVIFLGVNIRDAESDAKQFVKDFGITYPTMRDLDQTLTKAFGVKGLPETFFVDHRWTFIGAVSGPQTGDQQGTVILGAISEEELFSNVDVLISRMRQPDDASS